MNREEMNRAGYEECIAAGLACDVVLPEMDEPPRDLTPEQRLAVDHAVDAALARQSVERRRAAADACAKALPGLAHFNAA